MWLMTIKFRPAVNYEFGRKPKGIAVADFNEDGQTDLLRNVKSYNMIMLSGLPNSELYLFKQIQTDSNGIILMGKGYHPIWCNTSESTLVIANVDRDKYSNLVCNNNAVNQIMLDTGDTQMAGYDK